MRLEYNSFIYDLVGSKNMDRKAWIEMSAEDNAVLLYCPYCSLGQAQMIFDP